MKSKTLLAWALMVLMAGCTAVEQRRALVNDGRIENSSLGFLGFFFVIPDGFEGYNPAVQPEAGRSELQQLAIRVYELTREYHPSGNETFYEGFLMLSQQTAFLLVTVTSDGLDARDVAWDDVSMQRELLPMYNATERERFLIGDSRLAAVRVSGRAYESDGWYYSKPKSSRTEFCYRACRVEGGNRDHYILMGFSLPEYEHVLSLQMQEVVQGFQF